MSSEPSTPMTLSAFLPPLPPQPQQYSQIIHSIQRRSVDRASEDGGAFANKSATLSPSTSLLDDLEADLRLSAQIGVALLEEKSTLERKLSSADAANQKLLDRLTASVKESAQLQRRLEEAVGNLEQEESNNRALLVTLEEDRKKMSRLMAESARLSNSAAQLKVLGRAHEDLQQELVAEQKRASTAETRGKKQGERMAEMEDRLRRAIQDLEEMRQDKVLRSRKSHDALAKAKARLSSSQGSSSSSTLLHAASAATIFASGSNSSPETVELLKLVESLVTENDSLRSEALELHELLDDSREEQSGLRSAMAHRPSIGEEDAERMLLDGEDDGRGRGRRQSLTAPTLLSDNLMSPSASQQSFSDFDSLRPLSPFSTSTNPTSFARSWAPPSVLSSHASRYANRPLSSRSASPDDRLASPIAATAAALANVTSRRKPAPLIGTGQVPIGRGHNRRALSMDVKSFSARSRHSTGSAPSSPMVPQSPPNPSRLSSDEVSEGTSRPKRQHRPLSLSLGPSLFPQLPEDALPSSAPPRPFRRHSHHPTPSISLSVSTAGGDYSHNVSGNRHLSSPKKRMRRQGEGSEEDEDRELVVKVDAATQTSSKLLEAWTPSTSTPRRGVVSTLDSPGKASTLQSAVEIQEGDKVMMDFGLPPGSFDARTAVLGTLIEYTGKLLTRVQSADIASQEKRLKKQNLPGDVRHLAQANLKDLLNDIEGLRTHFRRVLEQERMSAAKETASSHSEAIAESLVVRRDFVSLVKLFRDLLFETSRLRSLVNRVELDPNLAYSLRDLDIPNVVDPEFVPKPAPAGILAPLSRLFSSALSSEPEPPAPKAINNLKPSARPIVKLSGSSAVTSTTVNVEFGKGATRRAVAMDDEGSPDVTNGASFSPPTLVTNKGSLGHKKSGTQVKRDLSSIFAGGLPASASNSRPGVPDSWVVVPPPSGAPTSRVSSNPFGRLLAAYRPAMASTTNAVLDPLPHAPRTTEEPPRETLLERQLRPRGLSDSSIRSSFIAHANPHHRLISPATLALSGETPSSTTETLPKPIIIARGPGAGESEAKQQLSDLSASLSRKASKARLRSKPSQMDVRINRSTSRSRPSSASTSFKEDALAPPVPAIPISMSSTPSSSSMAVPIAVPMGLSSPGGGGMISGSLFGNLTNWASRAAALSPIAKADLMDGMREGGSEENGGVGIGEQWDRSGRRA